MSGGVIDGQPVDQATTNPAFLFANGDDTALGKIGFNDAAGPGVSGTAVANIQREANALWSFLGGLINQAKNYLPTWATSNFGGSTDSVFVKVSAIDAAFSSGGSQFERAATVSIASSAISKAVTFSSPFPTSAYAIDFVIENTVDSSPIFIQGIVTARSASGFTVTFNAPTDTSNYSINYIARKVI